MRRFRPPRTVVSGQVTYQGKPLPTGSVQFILTQGKAKPSATAIDLTGHYQLEAVPGPCVVRIQMICRLRGQPAPTGEEAKLDIPEVDWLIPEKHADHQTSDLKATMTEGKEQQIDFPPQDKAGLPPRVDGPTASPRYRGCKSRPAEQSFVLERLSADSCLALHHIAR
jgi:hypothetical protein